MSNVDLSQLAVDRKAPIPARRHRRAWMTRYAIPATLIAGFLALLSWGARDVILPARSVEVIPVMATQSRQHLEGTPLFEAAGWIEPRPTPIRVAALAQGVVEKLLVVEDQPVTAGQPIAELIKDDAQLSYRAAVADEQLRQAELNQATATLSAATTRLEQPVHLEANLGQAEAELAKVHTMLENLPFETRRAESQLEFTQEDLRGKTSAKRAIARRTVDAAQSDMETAQAMVAELHNRNEALRRQAAGLEQRRNALKTQLQLLADEIEAKDRAHADVQAAQARLTQAQVAVAEAKLRLDRMTVRSPVDGRVYRLLGHPGADTSAVMVAMQGHDARTIVTLYQPEMLQVRVDVRFEDVPKVTLNQPVTIDNPALSESIAGHVLYVSSEADIQKNTLQVKVGLDTTSSHLKPEMLVDVLFLQPGDSAEQLPNNGDIATTSFYVPEAFVRTDSDGSFVWVADQSKQRARRVAVEVGGTGKNGFVEIVSGLNRSSRIITTDLDEIVDKERIRIQGESALKTARSPAGQDERDRNDKQGRAGGSAFRSRLSRIRFS